MILLICVEVGLGGRVVRSAKATVPFLARFIGQGVLSANGYAVIVRCKVPVPSGGHPFEQVSVIVHCPGPLGVPEMLPLVVLIVKPPGRKLALKLVGL
jgi:hypothetical protein